MRRSKLESYEAILEALVNEPLPLENLAYVTSIECAALEKHLSFLMSNELVEERSIEGYAGFAISERGIAVLRALNFQKYLGKIKNTLRAVDEALQVLPEMARPDQQTDKDQGP